MSLSDSKRQLEGLKSKIESTWSLLDIDQTATQVKAMEIEMQLSDFWQDREKARQVSKRHEDLKKEVDIWRELKDEVGRLLSLALLLEKNPDKDLEEEIENKINELEKRFNQLEFYILLSGKHDKKNAIVAIHAGSGGTEAQDWAEMLRRMIMRYADNKGWSTQILEDSPGQEAGIKSTILRVEGRFAYGHLQSEHGTHRLVRISPFDAEKMRHTSFALIEVIPEIEKEDLVEIDPNDLRIDTFMAGGHGGQSVNTTYSAVRVVHVPTGITVQCQNERSQLQNKETALRILHSKLQKLKEEEEEKERKELRGEYRSAEWGNQIRSYVLHPYKMVKDLRTRFETSDPAAVLEGGLDEFVEAYLKWKKEESLK